jgi:protein-S-isoprenylcysteine O-methyltransferase Ste14
MFMSSHLRNIFFKDVTYYIEKYILSSFMLYYALKNLLFAAKEIAILSSLGAELGQGGRSHLPEAVIYYPFIKYSLLFVFNAFNGGLLLRSKRPQQAPESWRDIGIPLLSAYSVLAYNLTEYMPGWMTVNYAPPHLLFFMLVSSCLLSLTGQLISLIAVFYLRRSFALFIQVRDVIVGGPYKYVRHPMYTGYVVLTVGILLSNLCIAYILISVMYVGLLAYRARLEENRLAAHDSVYRENMGRTGFLFPRLSALTS